MDNLKMHPPDMTDTNIERIARIFPNCVTESEDENGRIRRSLDFDLLRQELSPHIVEGPKERYHLNWPGKRQALLTANAPIAKTLRPCREESVDFDTTENIFIEGDNLDALKLLQETYLGKVKMIYIDPPYNTGKDFIYSDRFARSSEEYMLDSGQKDEEGNRLVANTESNGRFHSDWLSMMYSRLKLARNLLRDDGVLFISINENEFSNLRNVCFEIFGKENYCADLIWNTEGNTDNQYKIKVNHEFILVVYKNIQFSDQAIGHVIDPNTRKDSNLWKGIADNNINKNNPANPPSIVELPIGFPCSEDSLFYKAKCVDDKFYNETQNDKYISEIVKKKYEIENLSGLPVKLDDMVVESGRLVKACRIYGGMANKNKLLEFIANDCEPIKDGDENLSFYINSNAAVRYNKKKPSPRNILSVLRNFGTTERTKSYLRELGTPYDYPKPVDLLKYLIKIGCEDKSGYILDFFSGSGTTAEAVLRLNLEDLGKRKFILVQLSEQCNDKTPAFKKGFETITSVCKERIRRAGTKIKEEQLEPGQDLDIGFRVFKIDSSNMADVFYTPDELNQGMLPFATENIKADRGPEDLLFQVLLDWGVDLSLPVETETIMDREIFFVDTNAMAACFEKKGGITEELCRELAKRKPLRVVFRDSGFKDDSVKINVTQIFKLMSPETEVKTI